MKILHISASYKPAYIYGGPIQSMAKLCEALARSKKQGAKNKEQGKESKVQRAGLDRLESFESSFDSVKDDNTQDDMVNRAIGVEVFTTTANGNVELAVGVGQSKLIDGVPVTYFKRWTKDHSHFSPGLLWVLRKEILRCAQDDRMIVHIHAWWNLVSVLSCFIAKWYNIPVVLSPRGMLTTYSQNNRHSYLKRFIHLLIGKRLLEYCHIHATSEQEKNEIFKIVKPKSIEVIWNLVGMEEQGAKSKEQGTKSKEQKANSKDTQITFKVIFLSRIEQKKGLELLFDALADIDIPWNLTIAGGGEESYVERLKAKAESLKLDDRINWIGHVPNENKFQILADHDLLVLPSYNENFANVAIESLSVGTPVLVSENVGLADYVKANKFGWVCSLYPMDIKTKLNEAYNNLSIRDKIRDTAQETINKDFSEEVLVKQYLGLYENALRLR